MKYYDVLNSIFFIVWTVERVYYYKYFSLNNQNDEGNESA